MVDEQQLALDVLLSSASLYLVLAFIVSQIVGDYKLSLEVSLLHSLWSGHA